MDDQVDMRLLKIEQYALENRAEIQALQEEVKELKNKLKELIKITLPELLKLKSDVKSETDHTNIHYSFERRIKLLEEYKKRTSIKLERIEDILVVHRDQNDTQRKNYASLVKVWDEKVLPLIEGTHEKE
tara:strand:+ start:264 stop:653 length:390 start_codon:yes stop_codon:yes gene_type:complete